jgi:hypothetical protein
MSNNKAMPKGGRKGGTQFPRLDLKQAIDFAKRLVSKTHTGPQPEKIILKGVFNNTGPTGKVRAATMKQYDLLQGSPQAYEASDMAKQIAAAPSSEVSQLYKNACLKPKLFKTLYDTFHGDEVAKAKIRQQAANLKVHPDSLDECVSIFVKSAVFASLASENGDNVTFTAAQGSSSLEEKGSKLGDDSGSTEEKEEEKTHREGESLNSSSRMSLSGRMKAQVEIKIDPSMDPEKLEKLLGVLKKYGQI